MAARTAIDGVEAVKPRPAPRAPEPASAQAEADRRPPEPAPAPKVAPPPPAPFRVQMEPGSVRVYTEVINPASGDVLVRIPPGFLTAEERDRVGPAQRQQPEPAEVEL